MPLQNVQQFAVLLQLSRKLN